MHTTEIRQSYRELHAYSSKVKTRENIKQGSLDEGMLFCRKISLLEVKTRFRNA